MKKILLTGGAGFMGSHVLDELLNSDNQVIVIDDLSGGFLENVNPKAKFIQGSIEDQNLLEDLFKEYSFDYVFHLAAYAAEGLSHFIRKFNYNNNLIGSINLINLSIKYKIKCFVFTSSIAVYGKNQLPMNESMQPSPEDPYGIAKYAIELDLKAAKELFNLNYIIFRPHNVYGERQNIGDKYRNVIGIFMNQIMESKPITIFGDGEQTRAFSYIKDVAPIIAKSINNKKAYNEIFNVGADKPYSINDLAEIVFNVFNKSLSVNSQPARNEVIHAFSSHEKLKSYFNYESQFTLKEGVEKMYKWAKIEGAKDTQKFSNIEIKEGLPAIWSS